jgi:transposase-like protein
MKLKRRSRAGLGRHTTEKERMEYIARFEQSGLSCQEFCLRHGLLSPTFCNWRRAAREKELPVPTEPVQFTEVSAIAAANAGDRAVLYCFPEGGSVEVAAGTDIRWLHEIVQALRTPVGP